jgi:hypothetical protein
MRVPGGRLGDAGLSDTRDEIKVRRNDGGSLGIFKDSMNGLPASERSEQYSSFVKILSIGVAPLVGIDLSRDPRRDS